MERGAETGRAWQRAGAEGSATPAQRLVRPVPGAKDAVPPRVPGPGLRTREAPPGGSPRGAGAGPALAPPGRRRTRPLRPPPGRGRGSARPPPAAKGARPGGGGAADAAVAGAGRGARPAGSGPGAGAARSDRRRPPGRARGRPLLLPAAHSPRGPSPVTSAPPKKAPRQAGRARLGSGRSGDSDSGHSSTSSSAPRRRHGVPRHRGECGPRGGRAGGGARAPSHQLPAAVPAPGRCSPTRSPGAVPEPPGALALAATPGPRDAHPGLPRQLLLQRCACPGGSPPRPPLVLSVFEHIHGTSALRALHLLRAALPRLPWARVAAVPGSILLSPRPPLPSQAPLPRHPRCFAVQVLVWAEACVVTPVLDRPFHRLGDLLLRLRLVCKSVWHFHRLTT